MFRILKRQISNTHKFNTRQWIKIKDKNLVKLRCVDVLYLHLLGDEEKPPIGIDPEGGPFISVGQHIEIDNKNYRIEEISSIEDIKCVDIVFKVSEHD